MKHHSIVVTHGNCPDGAASAVLAKLISPDAHAVFAYHDRIDSQVLDAVKQLHDGGALYIADISCGEEALQEACRQLRDKNAGLFIYEHHISRSFLKDFVLPEGLEGEIIFDLKRCGSRIFFDTYLPRQPEVLRPYRDLIRLTNDRDLWINEYIESAQLGALHSIYGDERYVARFLKNPSVLFAEKENVLLDYEKELMMRRMQKLMSTIEIFTDADGYRYGIMVGEGKASEVCNTAIHKHNLEYVFLIDYNNKRASVRSNKEFDCAAFSSSHGGGGHERAAGFPIERADIHFS